MRTFGAAVALAACGGARQVDDSAIVCLGGANGEPVELAPDEPLPLTATVHAGCHVSELLVDCAVAVEGDRLEVTTSASWIRTEPLAMGCELVLLSATDGCAAPALAPGSYTLAYAGRELGFEVPGPAGGCLQP